MLLYTKTTTTTDIRWTQCLYWGLLENMCLCLSVFVVATISTLTKYRYINDLYRLDLFKSVNRAWYILLKYYTVWELTLTSSSYVSQNLWRNLFIKFLTSPFQGSMNSLWNKRFFNKQRAQCHVYSILGDVFISSFDVVSAFVVVAIIVMSNLIQGKKVSSRLAI